MRRLASGHVRHLEINDIFSTHALVDEDGTLVRVISANAEWVPRRMRDDPIAAQ